jgi:hypothetical protein
MSKVHILERNGSGNDFSAVAHFAVPAGSNQAGVPWKTAYLASYNDTIPVSRLIVGSGPGKITSGEANQITNGDLIEIPFTFSDDGSADKAALATTYADRAIDEFKADFALRFKFYGQTFA